MISATTLDVHIQAGLDLADFTGAFKAQKKSIPVPVVITNEDGVIETLEGPVQFKAGDAIMTGIEGEQWPIPAEKFSENYAPIAPTQSGRSGMYQKRPMIVWVVGVQTEFDVTLSDQRGVLHAIPGDFVVQYTVGDYAVINHEIFYKSYGGFKDEGQLLSDAGQVGGVR